MSWKNVRRDGVPDDKQEVLLSVDGVYHIAVYDAENNIFRFRDEIGSHFSVDDTEPLYWQSLGQHPG